MTEQYFVLSVLVLEIGSVVSTQEASVTLAGARRKRDKILRIIMLYCCGGRLERVSLKSVPISTVVILIYLSDGQIIAQKNNLGQPTNKHMRESSIFTTFGGVCDSKSQWVHTTIARFEFLRRE
jgi:hypothetical protein